MKLDTIAMLTKGACLFIGASCGALVAGLSQWVNTDDTPNKIEWTMILAGCVGSGTSQLVSYLSETFGKWKSDRNGNGNSNGTAPPAK